MKLTNAVWFESVKSAVCISIALITTTGVMFMSFYRGFIEPTPTLESIHVHASLMVYDSFINTLCLHLQFKYMENIYWILCCPIRSVIKRCFVRRNVIKDITKDEKSDTNKDVTSNEATTQETDTLDLQMHKVENRVFFENIKGKNKNYVSGQMEKNIDNKELSTIQESTAQTIDSQRTTTSDLERM